MATDSETEETEEQQEKFQWVRKWKAELQVLKDYHKSLTSLSTTCQNGVAAATRGTWSPASQSLGQASSSRHSRHDG